MNNQFADKLADRLYEHAEATMPNNLASCPDMPLTPLHTRLQRLLDSRPASAQHQGLSLLDLQAQLRGRKGRLPHIGEMGAAMRRLGWHRRREWSDENTAFSSRWYPPAYG